MKPPRVLLLAQTPPPYHGQSVMQERLVRAGWTWCTLEHIRLDYSGSPADVGRFTVRKVLRLVTTVLRVWRARLQGPIDLLYYPPAGPHLVPVLRDLCTLPLIRWTARRVVFHFHAGGFDAVGRTFAGRLLAAGRLVYGGPDGAIVLHDRLAGEVAWIRPRALFRAANGIPAETPVHAARDRGVILYLGLLAPSKGVPDLIDACVRLRSRGTDFRLHLAGAPVSREFASALGDRILRSGLGDRVMLHGEVRGAAKRALLAGADVFCYPSRDSEAMPVALLEALAASLPVVTSAARALPEIVSDAGVVVPPGDPEALAQALGDLLGDPARRAAMGEAGRALFLSRYTLARHLETMEEIFRKVLAR